MFELPIEKSEGCVHEVDLGFDVKVGGASALPFYTWEGQFPNRPKFAIEITDVLPKDWPKILQDLWGEVINDPVAWAGSAIKDHKADGICLNLIGTNQDKENKSPAEAANLVKDILGVVNCPIIVKAPGSYERQNEVLLACAEAAGEKKLILASTCADNYRSLAACAIAGGHVLVAESPIDVNMAKQLNILLTQMNVSPNSILIDPLTGGLGYGLEYTYSVMERIRLQALSGDPMMQMPMICFVGEETWRLKETRVEEPAWGDPSPRGINWEVLTGQSLLLSGADLVVLRHPESLKRLASFIEDF